MFDIQMVIVIGHILNPTTGRIQILELSFKWLTAAQVVNCTVFAYRFFQQCFSVVVCKLTREYLALVR